MDLSFSDYFLLLKSYCEAEDFKGWDPYDGLNSRVFQCLPLIRKSRICKLVMIQGFKRSPFNLRKLFCVPKGNNPKGLGLFLSGYCNLYEVVKGQSTKVEGLGSKEEILDKINYLGDLLLSLQSKGKYHGSCWGYNFDWQSSAFFLPIWTPTVVATSFVVEALLSAYEITQKKEYYDTAISSAQFILQDLNRIPKGDEFMFSYSPLDKQAVYNATLLGSKTLALIYHYTKNEEYKNIAVLTAKAVCRKQNADGSFPHSDQVGEAWRDNFHTGFKLESLSFVQKYCEETSLSEPIEKGYQYWINNYFDFETGIARYYDRGMQPDYIDLHCFAQSIPTLFKLSKLQEQETLVKKEIEWVTQNMQSSEGWFYFQKKGNHIIKIPYMRWPNAWCFYGISYWFLYNAQHGKN